MQDQAVELARGIRGRSAEQAEVLLGGGPKVVDLSANVLPFLVARAAYLISVSIGGVRWRVSLMSVETPPV